MEYQVNREPRRTVHNVQPGAPSFAAASVPRHLQERVILSADEFAHLARLRVRQARLRLRNWEGDVDAGVRSRPRRAMLTALTVGLVLGFLLRRRQILNREEVYLG